MCMGVGECDRETMYELKAKPLKTEIRDGTKETGSHWKSLTGQKQIVLVDFDHTITKKCLACTDGLAGDGIQIGCREALELLSMKYQIWIFTGNYDYLDKKVPAKRSVREIRNFLKKNKIPFNRILQIKPPACFIIDDRAIHHTSWESTFDTIMARESMIEC